MKQLFLFGVWMFGNSLFAVANTEDTLTSISALPPQK